MRAGLPLTPTLSRREREKSASSHQDRLRRVLPRESEILERLRQKGARVLSFKDLAAAFHVRPEDEDELRERLDALERKGEIARVRGEKYSAIEFSNLIAGRLTVRPEGYGFVLV